MSPVRINGTTGYVELAAPSSAASNTLTLPTGNGSANQRLVTNGSGTLSWTSDAMLSLGSVSAPSLFFSGDASTGMWSPGTGFIAWSIGGIEAARFENNGVFIVNGTSSYSDASNGRPKFQFNAKLGSHAGCASIADTTSAIPHIIFKTPNGVIGSIATSGSATAYNTSSDYRLKENVTPLTGAIGRLNQLQVHRFNFKADPDKTVDGFIAHEAQAVVPEAVTGTKDEVDADGNPIYQGIDQSKLVPLLTAALQEAIAKIETLEAKVAALEAQP